MKIKNFSKFIEKIYFKKNTMNESELRRFYNYAIYPKDSKF